MVPPNPSRYRDHHRSAEREPAARLALLSRASETSGGVQANAQSFFPALSADGRWVAFISRADNLVAGDTNQQPDVFVRDNWTEAVARVSVSSLGTQTPH